MASKINQKWLLFGDFFEEAANLGIANFEAAEALLEALRSDLRAYGHRRRYIDGATREVLPRDVSPLQVPLNIWREVGQPGSNLCSHWVDNPDKPEEYINIDWVSGALSFGLWEFLPDLEYISARFDGLRIESRRGLPLLAPLAGRSVKKRGRPRGASNDWEDQQISQAIQLILEGDLRSHWKLANEHTDPTLEGEDLKKQIIRIYSGIRTGLRNLKK